MVLNSQQRWRAPLQTDHSLILSRTHCKSVCFFSHFFAFSLSFFARYMSVFHHSVARSLSRGACPLAGLSVFSRSLTVLLLYFLTLPLHAMLSLVDMCPVCASATEATSRGEYTRQTRGYGLRNSAEHPGQWPTRMVGCVPWEPPPLITTPRYTPLACRREYWNVTRHTALIPPRKS